jgi:hypothetical protein
MGGDMTAEVPQTVIYKTKQTPALALKVWDAGLVARVLLFSFVSHFRGVSSANKANSALGRLALLHVTYIFNAGM